MTRRRPCSLRFFLVWPLLTASRAVIATCGMTGDKCSMPRDCCEAHECVEGDWALSTDLDFSCQRQGEKPTVQAYVDRLDAFYAQHNPEKARGGRLALEATVTKWDGREERLFHALAQKYSPRREEL